MLRHLLCGFVALTLVAGVGLAAEKAKKGKTASGAFVSFKDGTLTVKVKGKKGEEPKAQDFKVADDLKVTAYVHDEKREVAVKDAFKDLKDGTNVVVKLTEDDKVIGVTVGTAPKQATGTFTSFKDGTLILKVKGKNGETAKEYKVTDDTKAVTLIGKDKKAGTAKDALASVAEGTRVTITLGAGNKVIGVEVGNVKPK